MIIIIDFNNHNLCSYHDSTVVTTTTIIQGVIVDCYFDYII